MEESRVHLDQLAADFPGAEGEQALNKELKETATSYAQWLGQRLPLLRALHDEICDRPLDALMSDDDWESLRRRIEDPTTTIFGRTYVAGLKKDTAFHLSATHKFDFPLREDALDMYTQSRAAYANWPTETLERFEKMARHSDTGASHRIGGFGNPMQGEWDPSDVLLFQLVSDSAMGWVWADLGALYITISPKDLRKGRFDRVNAWMDGG